ncbi:MAG: beta strand repeat-containing protein [Gammaproteobacteria bacterium]
MPVNIATVTTVLIAISMSNASAADYDWLNTAPTGPYYDDTANWTTGVVPGASDNAIFSGVDSDVWLRADVTNNASRFGDGEFSLDLNGYNWTSSSLTDGLQVGISAGDNGTLNISDGYFDTGAWSQVGLDAGSSGTVNIGAGGTLETFMRVGVSGTGALNVSNGGELRGSNNLPNQSRISVAEQNNSSGYVTVTGTDSKVDLFGQADFGIGSNTDASLTVTDNGYFRGVGMTLAQGNGSDVTLTVDSGGRVDTGYISDRGDMVLALGTNSKALVSVDGAGSEVDIAGGLFVGHAGSEAQVDVTNAALLETGGTLPYYIGARTVRIGTENDNSGIVNIDGAGSEWDVGANIYIGNSDSTNASGELNITNGALVDVKKAIDFTYSSLTVDGDAASGSTGVLNIDGGTMRLESVEINFAVEGDGELIVENGGRIEGGLGVIGDFDAESNAKATLTGAGTTWDAFWSVNVYDEMNVLDGATVSASGGVAKGGTVNIDGAGSRWDSQSDLVIDGDMNITDGAVVGSARTGPNGGIYGGDGSEAGATTVDGVGSELYAINYIYSKHSDIHVSNGGQVTAGKSLTVGGNGSGTTVSHVSVSSGSSLNVGENIYITDDAGNRLTVNDSSVTANNIYVQDTDVTLEVSGDGGVTGVASDITGDVTNDGVVEVHNSAMANFNSDFQNNHVVDIEDGSSAVFAGTLSGDGDFTGLGDAIINGVLAPGNSPGLMSFEGDLEFGSTSIFEAELAGEILGDEYDSILVGGTATLGGTLEVLFIDGFSATAGDRFDLLVADTIVGQFDLAILPELSGGKYWELDYQLDLGGVDRVQLTAVPVPAAVWMFGSALFALLGWRRVRQ